MEVGEIFILYYITLWSSGVECGVNIYIFDSRILLEVACMQNIALQVAKKKLIFDIS